MNATMTGRLRDPVNGMLHLAALVLSLVGTAYLAWALRQDPGRALAGTVYGLTMCGCFLASSLHHGLKGSRVTELRLLKLDHAAIYPFIAGTYTPVCLYLIPGAPGQLLLAVVWAIALLGIVYKLVFARDPERVDDPPELGSTLLYVAMGWLIVWRLADVVAHSVAGSIALAVAGGLAYTVGGVILTCRLFDWWPGRWGHHETWHVCVMLGAASFYAYVFLNLV